VIGTVLVAIERVARGALALALLMGCQAAPPEVAPSEGAFRGGDALRITGEGFAGRGPLAVYVCQRAAKAVVVEGDRLIRVRAPRADAAGICDVTLRFGEDDEIILRKVFTYREPEGDLPVDIFDQLSKGPAAPAT